MSNEWLTDNIITVAQKLMLQHYPHMSGLQPPVLQETLSFQVHREEFVQILNIHNYHWCVVTNIGCKDGVVNVYDSLYASVSNVTARVIASLLFCSAPRLTIRMMDVEEQKNGADCGVLSIAYAYDICSGMDPRKVIYDHMSIRNHLAKCLEECKFSRFPVLRERKSNDVKNVQEIDLHCTCRLPEEKGVDMAECESCGVWFHRHCEDIPAEVFARSNVHWICKACTQS